MNTKNAIFKPIKIGRYVAKNRIEIAPAGAFLNGMDGSSNDKFRAYMKHLSSSGAGIVTIGVSDINHQSIGGRIPALGNPFMIPDYEEITEIVHTWGSLASIELVPVKEMLTPPEILVNQSSPEDIKKLISEYADAAEICVKAGFDMIMIHGGHGNVPSMFFSSHFNHRTDSYGGSFENRCRFGKEILQTIRARVGDKLAIEYRISGEELTPDGMGINETLAYAKEIEGLIDMLHVSRGLLEEDELLPYIFTPTYLPRGMNLEAARKFKQNLSIPVNVVGSFDLDEAEKAIAAGDVDMVAMMRQMLADPLCIKKAERGKDDEIRPCIRCNTCINNTHTKFLKICCAINPLIGRETWFPKLEPKQNAKKAVMVGGGPANLEAARTAAMLGHQVVIFEQNEELGGALRMASKAEFKQDMRKYLDWSIRSVMENCNIKVHLNTRATKKLILAEEPDALFLAVGSMPIIPKYTATGTDKVVWVGDVELNKVATGEKVILVGAGFTGLEAALTLAREGKNVIVIDMISEEQIGADGIHISNIAIRKQLEEAGVAFICSVRLEDVTEEGAVVSYKNGKKLTLPCDTVVLSLGVRPETEQIEEFKHLAEETYVLGDCAVKGGTLANAVRMGFTLAMEI